MLARERNIRHHSLTADNHLYEARLRKKGNNKKGPENPALQQRHVLVRSSQSSGLVADIIILGIHSISFDFHLPCHFRDHLGIGGIIRGDTGCGIGLP